LKIVLHIFLKDVRRHWKEISLFFLCCGSWGWAVTHPLSWIQQRGVIPVAMFGLWVFLTIRVVHGECLVGDREFWQTRPYTGTKLLAAKGLFLVYCLNVPILITQIFLLIHSVIPLSWELVPGLLFLQLEFGTIVTFSAFVLAAVTESLTQWILAVGGLFIFGLVVSWFPWDKLPGTLIGQENIGTMIGAIFTVPALLLALVWQYTRRTVWLARLAIGLVALTVPVVILLANTSFIRSAAYSRSDGAPPFQISMLAQTDSEEHQYFRTKGEFSLDTLDIPITFNSTDPDLIVDVEGFRVLITGDNGWKWQSPWLNRSLNFSPRSPTGGFEFTIPGELADQISRVHADASVEIAYQVHRLGHAQKIDTSPSRFLVPGVGSCHWFDDRSNAFSISGYNCVAPLRLPGVLTAEIDSGDLSCKTEKGEPAVAAGHDASATEYGTDAAPADFDPNPVHEFHFDFGKWSPPIKSVLDPKNDRKASLCRGTPIFVRIATFAGRWQSNFSLGPLKNEKPRSVEENGETDFTPEATELRKIPELSN
jgi:hypothetical protein